MLLLTFRVVRENYAVDVARVVEVVPKVEPRPIPRTPSFLAGLFGYRGRVVPAIDMGLLLGKVSAPSRLSTRVIVVEARKLESGQGHVAPAEPHRVGGKGREGSLLLGLIAEQVNDVIRVDQQKVVFPSMRIDDAPFLGEMIQIDSRGQSLAQLIDVDRVLPESLRDALFGGWEKTDEHPGGSTDAPGDHGSNEIGIDATSPSDVILGAGRR